MPLRAGLRRQRRALSLTSLIDVIFLLLLFFMLSSTFTRFSEIQISAALGGTAALSETPPLFLRLSSDDIVLNGQTASLERLASDLRVAAQEAEVLLISLTEDVTSQRLTDLLVEIPADLELNVLVLE